MNQPSIHLTKLTFSSSDREKIATLDFPHTFTFVFGASNTGKSFAVKAIDFMLGGSRELPDIAERVPYSRVSLELGLVPHTDMVLERAIVGGDFNAQMPHDKIRTFSARHKKDNNNNLSNFLLNHLGIAGKEVAQDKSGTKKSLSFRDIARFCITDETSIQSETSPAESGDVTFAELERNVFKFILSGEDDSALVTRVKPKDFATGRAAQVSILEEMILGVEAELEKDFPDAANLEDALEAVEAELEQVEREVAFARNSVRSKLQRKKDLAAAISQDQQRVNDIVITLENFKQLMKVYNSDISRLESIEEVGFLLGLHADETCPVCGALPNAQVHTHALIEIEAARAAAEIEIAKIRSHKTELIATIEDTQKELDRTSERLLQNRISLGELEAEISHILPDTDSNMRRLSEIIPRRDHIRHGLELLLRRDNLSKQKEKIAKQKRVITPNAQRGLSNHTAQEFALEVGNVLRAWGFPGECRTFFDLEGTFDIIIDGKPRKNNGKGVRAITHAAFKVALMTYCHTRKLPHPGFIILDTPLITYRDPIRSNGGALSADEQAIKSSNLKEKMFEHLSSLQSVGQFILFDNADPPNGAEQFCSIQTFTNETTQGRQGLL